MKIVHSEKPTLHFRDLKPGDRFRAPATGRCDEWLFTKVRLLDSVGSEKKPVVVCLTDPRAGYEVDMLSNDPVEIIGRPAPEPKTVLLSTLEPGDVFSLHSNTYLYLFRAGDSMVDCFNLIVKCRVYIAVAELVTPYPNAKLDLGEPGTKE